MKEIDDILVLLITKAKTLWPEAEYMYTKRRHSYCSGSRGKRGQYFSSCSPAPEVSEEEYRANVAEGERKHHLAFMSELRGDYYTYEKLIKKDGWKQELIKVFNKALDE